MQPEIAAGSLETVSASACSWNQGGVTDLVNARRFLDALLDPRTLTLASADGDPAYRLGFLSHRARGQGAAPLSSVLAATRGDQDLHRYHIELGVAPHRVFVPARVSRRELAGLVLLDEKLCDELSDSGYEKGFAPYVSESVARLFERIRVEPTWCEHSPDVYTRTNDKLELARSGALYGIPTLPGRAIDAVPDLPSAWHELTSGYGSACVLRPRWGAGGRGLVVVRTLTEARLAWRRIHRHGPVAMFPWLPPDRILRQISSHGVVRDGRFSLFCITDQLLNGTRYRGGRQIDDWPADLTSEIQRALDAAARWLADLGFRAGAAGFDGLLVSEPPGTRFLLIDPNIRATGTTLPWATVARLSEAAGRHFPWQVQSFRILGPPPSLARLGRVLGEDLLNARKLSRGGILPYLAFPALELGPIAAWWLRAIFLADDADHLAHLAGRISDLGRVV